MTARAISPPDEGGQRGWEHSLVLTVGILFFLLVGSGYILAETGVVRFTYGVLPEPTVIYPNGNEIINGTINTTGEVRDQEGYSDITSVQFYAYHNPCYGAATAYFIANGTNTSELDWYATWNSSNQFDSSDWRIRLRAYDSFGFADDLSDGKFVVNNQDDEPTWDEFKNNLSTNLTALDNVSQLNDYIFVDDLLLANVDEGMINWSGQTVDVDGVSLDSYIEISPGEIKLDDCGLERLDRAAYLHFFNLSLVDPQPIRDGSACGSCSIVSYSHTNYSNGTLIYSVTDWNSQNAFVVFSVRENLEAEAWDQNDSGVFGGDNTAFRNRDLKFFARFRSTNSSVLPETNETFCQIRFNTTLPWTAWASMTYNTSSALFEYTRQFSPPGLVLYEVQCDSTLVGYYPVNLTENITIANRPPVLISDYPNIEMFMNTVATGQDLDDYFTDPDGDVVTFAAGSVSGITINITTAGLVTYDPDADFIGLRLSNFTATDSYGAIALSNNYNISVIEPPSPPPPPPPPPPSGGGGGGASVPTPFCPTDFVCNDWSDCKFKQPTVQTFLEGFTGYQTRTCSDVNNCGLDHLKPDELRGCHYRPTCFDLIKNQDEEGVDCGGPCPPCPSCNDGIRNQGEERVDCGGPCPACATCFDRIMNQGEDDVDCGGPCPPCKAKDNVTLPPVIDDIQFNLWLLLIMILMILLAIGVTTYFARPHIQRLMGWLQVRLEEVTRIPPPQPSIYDIEKKTIEELNKILGDLEGGSLPSLVKQYVKVMRGFYRAVTGLTFEFTYEELYAYLHAKSVGGRTLMQLRKHTKILNRITFGKDLPNNKQLKIELNGAKSLVHSVTRSLASKQVVSKTTLDDVKARKVSLAAQKRIIQIHKTLLKAEQAIESGRQAEAKALYNEVRSSYLRLPLEKRKDVLSKIRNLYERLAGGKTK